MVSKLPLQRRTLARNEKLSGFLLSSWC